MTPARKLGYAWHLRLRMAEQNMFATTDLVPLLAERGVVLSAAQVYRLVTQTPERLSLRTLMALCDILACSPNDLIEPVAATRRSRATGTRGAARPALHPAADSAHPAGGFRIAVPGRRHRRSGCPGAPRGRGGAAAAGPAAGPPRTMAAP